MSEVEIRATQYSCRIAKWPPAAASLRMASAQSCFQTEMPASAGFINHRLKLSYSWEPQHPCCMLTGGNVLRVHKRFLPRAPPKGQCWDGAEVSGCSGVNLDSPIFPFYNSLGSRLPGSPSARRSRCQLLGAVVTFLHQHSRGPHALQEPLASFPLRLCHFTLDMPCCYSYAVHPFRSKTQLKLVFLQRLFYFVF